MIINGRSLAAMLLSASIMVSSAAEACTRFVYLGAGDEVITARSMDWKTDVGTNLWVFPRGMKRSGEAGPNSIEWTSKYGSVIASGYDISTTDGMNEAGLVANVLWLVESSYPKYDGKAPGLTLAAWAQYAIETPKRDGLKAHLSEKGIPSVIYYVKPLHTQVAYRDYPRTPAGLAVSEDLPKRILCLPMHPYLSEADQDRIIETIRNYIGSNSAHIAAA